MLRYTVILVLAMALFTSTQAFSWGRVFNNNNNNEEEATKVTSTESHVATIPEETEVAEKPLAEDGGDEREKSFRAARAEERHEEKTKGRLDEGQRFRSDKMMRLGAEAASGSSGMEHEKMERDGELQAVQKEVSEVGRGLGPVNEGAERVEVLGVAREREHHITDGLADAIAGLMRVYNSLVRSDGQWESVVQASQRAGTANGTETETVRMAGPGRRSGGWAPLAVLAGIVVVAGAGVLLVGLVQRERGGPMYPPSGPAFV